MEQATNVALNVSRGLGQVSYFEHVPHNTPHGHDLRAAHIHKVSHIKPTAPWPKDVVFVYASNRDNKTWPPLKVALERLGATFHVIAQDYVKWNWWAKIGPLIDLLQSGNVTQKYIVMSDADDMFPLTTDFSGLPQAFELYDADMVLGASNNNWPPMPEVANFEQAVAPWARMTCTQFGQSSYMAKTAYLLKVLKEIDKPETAGDMKSFDDQAALRLLHFKHYPRIKVDSLRRIFRRGSGKKVETFQ